MWQDKYKKTLSRMLVVTLSLPVTILAGFVNPSIAHGYAKMDVSSVVVNEVLPQPTLGNDEMVELYNNSAIPIDISGWTLYDATSSPTPIFTVPASTTLAGNGFFSADLGAVSVLLDTGDSVNLKDASATPALLDSISYGDSLNSEIVSPGSGKTIGRANDGSVNWYSGLTPSFGSTNNASVQPSLPTFASINTTPVNVVNIANADAVPVTVTAAGVDTVTTQLVTSTSSKSSAATVSSTPSTTATVDSTAGSAINPPISNGSVTVRAYSTLSGINSEYFVGTPATADFTTPTLSVVSIASNNADSTVAKVGDTVTLSFTASENVHTPTVVIDGVSVVPTSSGMNWTASLTMASTNTEGNLPFGITFSDLAGNPGATAVATLDSSKVTFSKAVVVVPTTPVAPSAPANVSTEAGSGFVSLSWDSVSGATSYSVFYKVAGAADSTYKSLSVGSETSARVSGLKNGVEYVFNVQAFNVSGISSTWSPIAAKPAAPVIRTASVVTSSASSTTPSAAVSTTTTPSSTSTSSTTPSTDTSGKVSSASTSTSNETDSSKTRLYVTLLILLVAVGAGAAGYYGYQWWSERPVTTPEPVKPATPVNSEKPVAKASSTKKRSSKGGRW